MKKAPVFAAFLLLIIGILHAQKERLQLVPPEWFSFDEMHGFYVGAFISGKGFGLARVVRWNAPQNRKIRINDVLHHTGQVKLVGIVMAKEPRVYLMLGNPTKPVHEDTDTRQAKFPASVVRPDGAQSAAV